MPRQQRLRQRSLGGDLLQCRPRSIAVGDQFPHRGFGYAPLRQQ